ncbi:death domain-associated protein 6 isoform X1 [Varanus komodoensis]|uniref:death domain-associated protein 6 isoform X1 n=1 Tax=Varanus komodoensis TaxID=61221 RepID=UPI001CF78836|nr:death domain-associated protein 6 isoform X1 [Varanus komodoensis]
MAAPAIPRTGWRGERIARRGRGTRPAPSGWREAEEVGEGPGCFRLLLVPSFLAFCSEHTLDHPEVMSYLASRHQKTSPDFLASVEFHNVLSRCLARVKARQSKIYVYINELCTVFRAHSQKKKPTPVSGTSLATAAPAAPASPSEPAPEAAKPRAVSKRRIQDLENLLRVYSKEIRRLQERELDLEELDRADSAYLLEGRLKRRMMRVFQRLCELKDCSSLTGRVIEQRIPYRGTRYPEVNRRIERLINRPEAFPDYADILRVVQKASACHSLGLPKRQMESMAASAFREVGDLLQERRHLDLIYNFGSHLTDEYRPNTDPALLDSELARRLRHNRVLSLRRLEEVTSQYAQLQEKAEEWQWCRQGGRPRAGPSGTPGQPRGEPLSPQKPGAAAAATGGQGSPAPKAGDKEAEEEDEEEEDEEEEDEEDEEDEESSSSELDMDEELEKCLGREGPVPEDGPLEPEMEADQRMLLSSSAEDPEEEEDEEDEEEEEEEEEEESEEDVEAEEGPPPQQQEPPSPSDKPPTPGTAPEQFLLAIEEALSLEAGETPPPSPKPSPPPPRRTEPGGALPLPEQQPPVPAKRAWSPEHEGPLPADITALHEVNGQPRGKKARQEHRVSNSSCIEVPSTGSSSSSEEDEDGGGGGPLRSLSLHSPAPVVDSTCADSPSSGLVSSSQGSPQHLLLQVCKASVATQCDPEEIIVLSDSD